MSKVRIYLGSTQTVRQINKLVLTGQENISGATQLQAGYRFSLIVPTGKLLTAQSLSICSHFKYVSDWSSLGFTFGQGDSQLFIIADISGVNDTTTFANWLATQYANGTPVTIWYVLTTPETATVNEPLMKIGTYADTLSNAAQIPTTEGANSITIDTTVQPSEFTATWTGWHDAEVKEKSENLWNESYTGIMQNTITYLPLNVGDGNYTLSSTVTTEGQAAVLFLLSGNVSTGASTVNNGVWNGQSRTVTAVDGYVTIGYRKYTEANPENANTMLNTGSTALPYEPYWK